MWGVVVVLAVVVAVVIVEGCAFAVAWKWWRGRPSGVGARIGQVLLVAVGMFVLLGLVGTATGATKAFGAVTGEVIDPSQNARQLAEGISEAMNSFAFTLLPVFPVSLVVLAIAFVRRRRAARPE